MATDQALLQPEQLAQFHRDGFVILPGFYDLESQIRPIQLAIYQIVGLLIDKHSLPIERPPFDPVTFDAGYQALIAHDRRIGGVVYDAIKQIPAFVRLIACEKNERLFKEVRGTDCAGIAGAGNGIRIDNPGEETFRSDWHQEYPFQLRSLDGLTLWTPLLAMTPEMGPVQFAVGSHKDGLVRLHSHNPEIARPGAYAYNIEDREARIARYPVVQPLSVPGDLLLLEFQTLHASGHNRAQRSRWSMQLRYFNFKEPTGRKNDWCGCFAAGTDLRKVHPELVID